ncbi:hypothetical protein GTQ40_00775 [Flavobacteriaceae bacterium R38]|nr:hypothetical protein [Flavobacteriaceae bacterium R38]
MNKALITIIKGQFSDAQIRSLEQIVLQNYRIHISKGDLKIVWNLIPKGNTYRNSEIIQPSIISIGCEVGFPQESRLNMFESLSKDWLCITGQHNDDLIIAIIEAPAFEAFISKKSEHLTHYGKVKFYLNVMLGQVFNKARNGYYAFNSSF